MVLKVAIFPLGYLWDFDINMVASTIHKFAKSFEISIESPVRNIGNADLYEFGFSFERLFQLFPTRSQYTLQIGITSVPIENNDYGYYEKGKNNVLCTLFGMEEVCERAQIPYEEYVIQAILTAILWHQYHNIAPDSHYMDLFHDDARGCLFDFCGNKLDLVTGLRAKRIDSICKGRLVENNVSENLIEEVEEILDQLKKPSFLQSIQEGMRIPVFSFLLGGVIISLAVNSLTSLVLGDFDSSTDYYVILGLVGIAGLLIMGNYLRVIRQSKKRNYV
jgi:hypothetical protein